MNTKLLMTLSAIIMGMAGAFFLFLPQELLDFINSSMVTNLDVVIIQILGSLYFAFAMMNWAAKASLIGGIYSRPIALGNLTHFAIGALTLIKGDFSSYKLATLTITLIYITFAILFGVVIFRHPVKDNDLRE